MYQLWGKKWATVVLAALIGFNLYYFAIYTRNKV
jgi:hypothetical protein